MAEIGGYWPRAGVFADQETRMFDEAPATRIYTFRLREKMARDIKREAKKRKLRLSEEVRRRLQFYADHHAEKSAATAAK
jgi:hypothetical protein